MPNFDDILNKQADEVEVPKPLPAGAYTGIVLRHEFGESRRKQTPFVRFFFRPQEAMDDVDEDELKEFGGAEALAKKEMRTEFYLTENALFRLTNFLEATGLETSGHSLKELISETDNAEVMFTVVHTPSEDGEQIFANVGKVMAP